jgi:hypothetical protein
MTRLKQDAQLRMPYLVQKNLKLNVVIPLLANLILKNAARTRRHSDYIIIPACPIKGWSQEIRFFQRALAAETAISLRFFAERLAALALPPFKPPSLPNATAAGFLAGAGDGAACPVDC